MKREAVINIGKIKQVFFVRAKLNEEHALHLAELIEAGVELAPVEVAQLEELPDDEVALVDGRHRKYAYETVLDRKSMPVVYVKGTKEELLLRAIRANSGGSLATSGADINIVIKQLIAMKVPRTKIVQQMSLPHMPFTPSLIRRHLETVATQLTRDQIVKAQHAVATGGMTSVQAANEFDIPLGRLQTALAGSSSKKRKDKLEDVAKNITKSGHSRSKVISIAMNRAFEMFDDGEIRAQHIEKLLKQIDGLNKRANKLYKDWVQRFEERKRALKQVKENGL